MINLNNYSLEEIEMLEHFLDLIFEEIDRHTCSLNCIDCTIRNLCDDLHDINYDIEYERGTNK